VQGQIVFFVEGQPSTCGRPSVLRPAEAHNDRQCGIDNDLFITENMVYILTAAFGLLISVTFSSATCT